MAFLRRQPSRLVVRPRAHDQHRLPEQFQVGRIHGQRNVLRAAIASEVLPDSPHVAVQLRASAPANESHPQHQRQGDKQEHWMGRCRYTYTYTEMSSTPTVPERSRQRNFEKHLATPKVHSYGTGEDQHTTFNRNRTYSGRLRRLTIPGRKNLSLQTRTHCWGSVFGRAAHWEAQSTTEKRMQCRCDVVSFSNGASTAEHTQAGIIAQTGTRVITSEMTEDGGMSLNPPACKHASCQPNVRCPPRSEINTTSSHDEARGY